MTVTTELIRLPMSSPAAWVPVAYEGEAGKQAYLDGEHSSYVLMHHEGQLVAVLKPKKGA